MYLRVGMFNFIFVTILSLFSKSVAFVQASLSYTLCLILLIIYVRLARFRFINIFIKVKKKRVYVVYPMWVYRNPYDRLAVQFF